MSCVFFHKPWSNLRQNTIGATASPSCPKRLSKMPAAMNITRTTLQPGSGRFLLPRAAYFWANLPKLRCSGFYHQLNSTLFYRWPMEEGALHCWAVLHWGQTYKQFQGFRRWRRNLGNILLGLGCWEKRHGLGKWKTYFSGGFGWYFLLPIEDTECQRVKKEYSLFPAVGHFRLGTSPPQPDLPPDEILSFLWKIKCYEEERKRL